MTTQSSNTPVKRKALGRGIGALLEGRDTAPAAASAIRMLPVDHLQPNPYQPRQAFHPDRLNELAASVQANGVVQPILVRPIDGGRFEIVAGERRWRAARIAGLAAVPALVKPVPDNQVLEVALVENIQREDLNPIEMAHAFDMLSHEFGLTHDEIAHRTGKDRSSITNFLRLLKLPPEVQQLLAEEKLSMGHARALLALSSGAEQKAAAMKIVSYGLSVRAAERLAVKSAAKPQEPDREKPDPNTRAAVQEMERALGTRVRIVEHAQGRGRIEIDFYSLDDLNRIYSLIVKP